MLRAILVLFSLLVVAGPVIAAPTPNPVPTQRITADPITVEKPDANVPNRTGKGDSQVAPSTEPADDATPDDEPAKSQEAPRDEPVPDVHYGETDLPPQVQRMRDALIEAAESGEVEELRAVLEMNEVMPTLSFGEIGDPIEYLKTTSGDGKGREVLAILLEVLNSGWVHMDKGKPQEMYIWPYFAQYPLDKLTGPQMVELFKIITSYDYQENADLRGLYFLPGRHRPGWNAALFRRRRLNRRSAGQRLRQCAEHFVEKVCGRSGRLFRSGHRVVIPLDQVAADQVETGRATDDFEALNGRQAADFERTGSRRNRRVEAVNVETEIDRSLAHLGADFRHQRRQRFVPAFFRLNDAPTALPRPIEIVVGIAGCPQADLDRSRSLSSRQSSRARRKRRSVGDLLAEHLIIGIGVGNDMDQADRPVLLGDRLEDRIGDGVVAANAQRHNVRAQGSHRSPVRSAGRFPSDRRYWWRYRRYRRPACGRTVRLWSTYCRGGSSPISARICRGPKRVPARCEAPISNGTPTKQASSPAASAWVRQPHHPSSGRAKRARFIASQRG